MAAPTLIASIQVGSPWDQSYIMGGGVATRNYSGTLSTAASDLIVVLQGSADAGATGQITVSDGTNSYTQRTNLQNTNHCSLNIATANDSAGGTRTLTWARTTTAGGICPGGVALQFRSHGGVGNVYAAADGIQSGSLTCSANSAIAVICLDWGAVSGTRTWATINGASPTATYGVNGDLSSWAAAAAYFADVGAAGSKTITLSAPTFTSPTFAAIEILGTAGGGSIKRWAPQMQGGMRSLTGGMQ